MTAIALVRLNHVCNSYSCADQTGHLCTRHAITLAFRIEVFDSIMFMQDPQETILYLVPGENLPLTAVDSFHEGIRNKLKTFASAMGRKLLMVSILHKQLQCSNRMVKYE